ncbi:MAG: Ig-like domain-containing protein, partial [Alphaproteobacteria bacterium]
MARINGSNGNDSINGTRRNDDIRAKKGDDTVNAGDGNDYVDGGAGNDWIDGGAGNDKLKGGAGNDTLIGGAGADQLYGGSGDDVLMGDGPNVYAGGSGSGRRNGSGSGSGSGHGSHHGSGHGGSGSGHVSFNDYLNGGSGNDTVLGQLGDDTLKGGSGNDFLDGGVGRDHVDGDSGDDVGLFVGGENGGRVDWYDGGTGSDTLVISLTSAQFADPDIFADLQALDAFIAANADISTDSGAKQTFSNLGIRVQDWEDLTVLVDGDEVSLELDPLFTEQSDTVDFDDVQAGTYEDGTQYDALGSDDTVTMASSQGEANQAGYDTDVMFNAGAGDDTITGRGLDDKIAGGADDDTISGNDGEDLLIGDNADGGTSETFFATGGAQDWDDAGVTLTAYDFDGDEATVTYDGDGVGVAGGSPVGNQINHSSDGTSEALVATFDSPATEATVTVSRMYATENGGEQGAWQAYDAGGNLVGSGEFGPEITGGGNVGSFTISGIGEFSEIRFSGREYADGTPPGAGDSSDYYVKSIEYTTVDGGEYGDDNIDGGAGDDLIIGDNGDLDCVGHDWHWEHGDTNSSSAGGKIESVDTSIDTASQTVSFTMVVSDTNGNESNGFSLALNDGANPKGLGGELALLYFDASGSEPVLTAYAYNGVNAQTSYFDGSSASGTQAPDPIASSLADPSWVQDISYETDASGDVHTFHFTIDASAINGHDPMYPEAGGWTGLEFGEQLGMWLHPNSDIETAYDSEGFLTEYSTEGHGWLDVSYQQTEQVKAAPDVEGGDDVIDGGEGDDVAYGQGGDDTIVGGVGDDELYGQSGNDIIDGDAPASFVLEDIANNDGCFDISGACDITITADFLSSLAGYDNSFGYYLAGADGNPVSGEIIFADVKNSGPGVGDEVTISLDSDALDGATKLGFFIIPNGENLNPGLADGDDVTFAESGGDWTVISDGSPLAGQGAGVFFSNENLNPGGFDHEEDVAVEGNQNWEDIVNGGDGDHNDVNLNVTVQGNFFRSGIEYDGADASGSGAGSASGHGSGSGHHGHGSGSGSGHHGHGSGSGSASGHHGHGSGSGSGHRGSGSGSASGRNGRGSGSGSGSHGHGSASGSGRGSHRGSGSASGSHHGSHHGSGTGTGAGSVDISFNDYLDGGAGDDILDGNLGADFVYGNVGNDTGKFVVGEYGGLDIYDGGKGTDTLQVYVTSEQFADATIQAELQALQAFIDANSDASTNSGADATFTALDLNVEDWETLEIFVDGKIINDDELVDAIDDSGSVGEDGPGVIIGVLDNDDAPDGVGSVTIVTGPPSGTATVNPDNTITFDPNGDFEYLAEGETTTVTFVYELEDTDGDTDQATVTITITGTNDAPVIGIADNAGAVTEISDGAAGENVDDLTDTGSVAFSDSDLSDTHTVSSVDNGAGYIGSFATVISDPATGDGTGSIDWTFTVNDSLV